MLLERWRPGLPWTLFQAQESIQRRGVQRGGHRCLLRWFNPPWSHPESRLLCFCASLPLPVFPDRTEDPRPAVSPLSRQEGFCSAKFHLHPHQEWKSHSLQPDIEQEDSVYTGEQEEPHRPVEVSCAGVPQPQGGLLLGTPCTCSAGGKEERCRKKSTPCEHRKDGDRSDHFPLTENLGPILSNPDLETDTEVSYVELEIIRDPSRKPSKSINTIYANIV
ncbi:uncharacterized protein ACNLHF_000321 isoform 3-T5 [Anomaloglossus baeobatrachus]